MDIIRNLLVFIGMLGGLIFIHELAHFIVAVRCGVKVHEFGIGLPPRLRKLGTWRGTDFTLNWIPLGGFVRPEGEFDPALPRGLAASTPLKRLAIFAAGPIANLVIGFLIFIAGFISGWPDQVRLLEIVDGSPAQAAGLRVDDVLLRANGIDLHQPGDLVDQSYAHIGQSMLVDVQRNGQIISTVIVPDTSWSPEGRPTGVIVTHNIVQYPFSIATQRAAEQVIFQMRETVLLPMRLLARQLQPEEVRFSSVVGLKQVSDRVVENAVDWQTWFPILHLTAVVSIALGLTNLLPLPALDGGRMLFVLIEIVRRKRINARIERMIHVAGMLALFGLMFVLVVQDLLDPLI